MQLKSVQNNFTDDPARFFYIVAKKKGIPAKGLHLYKDETANMLIKLFGLFTVVNAKTEDRKSPPSLKLRRAKVGRGRFELPTSCLSSKRSEPTELTSLIIISLLLSVIRQLAD